MPIWERGYQQGAKDGTVFLSLGPDFGDLATDLSQEATDLASASNRAWEILSSRFNVLSPRTIQVRVLVANTDTGEFFRLGVVPDDTRIRINSAGFFQLREAGWTVSVAIPNVAASARWYEVAWVTAINPDATGTPDASISWLLVIDTNSGERFRYGPWTHPTRISDTGHTASIGAEGASGGAAYTNEIERFSVHSRAMTLAEFEQDWVSSTSPPATALADQDGEVGFIPIDAASGIGDVNELQGPAFAWAARNHLLLRRRLASGSHIRMRTAPTLTRTADTTASQRAKIRLASQSTLYRWAMPWLQVYPVAANVSHVWVSVHLQSWVTSGAAVPIGLRCYSLSRLPIAGGGELAPGEVDADAFEQNYVGTVVTRDDTSTGVGSHVELGLLPIVRGSGPMRRDKTYLVLAYAFDPANASGNDAAARFRISDWHVCPAFVSDTGGGLAFGGGA